MYEAGRLCRGSSRPGVFLWDADNLIIAQVGVPSLRPQGGAKMSVAAGARDTIAPINESSVRLITGGDDFDGTFQIRGFPVRIETARSRRQDRLGTVKTTTAVFQIARPKSIRTASAALKALWTACRAHSSRK